jgi:hypothetical protein
MSYFKSLYDSIISGNIENSIQETCTILYENNKILLLEDTLIAVCSYIGCFINIYNIAKYNDILSSTKNIIESDNINITSFLVLITKMCILCDIHIKNPSLKAGILPVAKLREKILDVFNDEVKLSSNGINRFEAIIPPADSDSYLLAIKIITSIIIFIKKVDNISIDETITIQGFADKLRNCFDYIIKKKYQFEIKITDDLDNIWFLWGFISILYNEPYISDAYWLFNSNYKKNKKKYRCGIIYGTAVNMIYTHKKNISSYWNKNELIMINKINEIALQMYNEVIKDCTSTVEKRNEESNNDMKGIDYLLLFKPKICNTSTNVKMNNNFEEENKIIE